MKNKIYNISIVISIILAIIFGIFFPSVVSALSFIGTIYINLLKFMIIPIIFTSIMLTIYESKKIKSNLVLKTIAIFIIMFLISFLIASLIVFILKPGIGYKFDLIKWNSEVVPFDIKSIIVNLFPSNIVTMLQNNSIFSTIILAVLFGYASSSVKESSTFISFIKELKTILYKILEYVMYITPLAIFSLLGNAISEYGSVLLGLGFKYILTAYLASIIVMVIVMIVPACIVGKVNVFTYIKNCIKVWIMTITTCSSVATLPTTISTCENDFKIPSKITNITVPLGCTIHMCGGAVSFALLALFTSQLFSYDISIFTFILMIISALLINMAAPGIPNGGIVIGATYLSLFGLPISFIGFYSSIYKLLDMSYTTLNVTGDISANIIINKLSTKNRKLVKH